MEGLFVEEVEGGSGFSSVCMRRSNLLVYFSFQPLNLRRQARCQGSLHQLSELDLAVTSAAKLYPQCS